jgi:NitT/TauT family transport system ATP-binding protein
MSGLHRLTSGEVLLDGSVISGPSPEIGMVFQDANLLPWRNLDANIGFPFEIKGTKPDRVFIDELLNRVGLEGFGGRFPRELSGGMQQRAALVRALSFKPSVLLMDEPFGALDAFTREEMNRLVEEIWLDRPTTIVLITHSIEEAIFLSDRFVVMSPRPGRVANIHEVSFPRPRSPAIMATKEVFDLTNIIKAEIVGEQQSRYAKMPTAVQNQPAQ